MGGCEGVPVVQLTKHNPRDGDRCLSNVCCHDNLEEVIDHEERIGISEDLPF